MRGYWSGHAPLDQEKGRRALRRRPCPATAGSRAGSISLHSAVMASTQHLVDAIARGYDVTVLKLARTNQSDKSTKRWFNHIRGSGLLQQNRPIRDIEPDRV